MKLPSLIGETAGVIAVLDFIYWVVVQTPAWTKYIWIVFGFVFIIDWMLGGVADDGICKRCFGAPPKINKN